MGCFCNTLQRRDLNSTNIISISSCINTIKDVQRPPCKEIMWERWTQLIIGYPFKRHVAYIRFHNLLLSVCSGKNMDTEPWNKINISCPGAISTVQIPFDNSTDILVTRLVRNCDKLLKLLQSKVLQTEVRVLYALLYVLNNSLRQHFTFRAIKQVEQCINRLKEMKLEAAVQDLMEMCPTKIQREVGKKFGQCEVPSQPMLEWLCLKALGACKLMTCLTDRCARAFRLTGLHLHWGEFIVLNVVLTSMLSRLRAFSQGIAWTLAPLYEKTLALLREVSRAKPMPFLTDFALPTDAAAFLGPSCAVRAGAEPGFKVPGSSRAAKLSRKVRAEGRTRTRTRKGRSSGRNDRVDVGSVVLQRRPEATGHLGGLDIKAMLKRPYGRDSQSVLGAPCGPETPHRKYPSQEVAVIGQKKSFLKRAQAAASSGDMAARLAEMIGWFKSRRLRSESGRLRLLQLKCDRLRRLESQGFRVDRKLKSLRGEVSGALLLGRSVGTRRYLSLHGQWRKLYCRTLSERGCGRARKRAPAGRESPALAGDGPSPRRRHGEERGPSALNFVVERGSRCGRLPPGPFRRVPNGRLSSWRSDRAVTGRAQ
ncbi:hypothetical protein AAFF_G00166710 [Aldrovandia affinis]|uniref:Nucleolus and neural progenitor protein-like N-terminal domain-containing protein n=1 Tax=Aldrovandia affinis TaxID=143900 RepID=A0AAD7RMK9_9TELE|nr:hypothetical protein AAFF_G00166710 [Aldrovandia affinis]